MTVSYLFDKFAELKEKFKSFLFHKKKLQALNNYSQVTQFPHRKYLPMIKAAMDDGFLGEKECDFLGYLLQKYELNFLDWCHRTRWLKSEMRRIAHNVKPKVVEQPLLFDLDKVAKTPVNIPLEMLAGSKIATTMAGRL